MIERIQQSPLVAKQPQLPTNENADAYLAKCMSNCATEIGRVEPFIKVLRLCHLILNRVSQYRVCSSRGSHVRARSDRNLKGLVCNLGGT